MKKLLIMIACLLLMGCDYTVPLVTAPAMEIDKSVLGLWQTTEDGKTTYFRVVNVWTSATTIDFRQEFSTDQEHWTVMASGHEVKVSEK